MNRNESLGRIYRDWSEDTFMQIREELYLHIIGKDEVNLESSSTTEIQIM